MMMRGKMKKYWYYFLFISLTLHGKGIAQEGLEKLKYEQLQQLEVEAYGLDNLEKTRKIAQAHVAKARKENNSLEVARAFYYLSLSDDPHLSFQYCDSIIKRTKESLHPDFPNLGYWLKGILYYNSGKFEESLENYLIAYDFAVQKKNIEHQRDISNGIAAIRNVGGQHSSAAEIYSKSLKLITSLPEYEFLHYSDYILLLYNLSLTHSKMQQIDSARIFVRKGLELTALMEDEENHRDFSVADAHINYFQNEYKKAEDTLIKYKEALSGTQLALSFYYLGKIAENRNEKLFASTYFSQMDSVFKITADPFPELKDAYQILLVNSIERKEKKKQLEYINKLMLVDSLLYNRQRWITENSVARYDLPYLKSQKQIVENQLKFQTRALNGAGVLASFAIFFGVYFYRRNTIMKVKLKELLENPSVRVTESLYSEKNPGTVPEEIRIQILEGLKCFENSKDFLQKDLDLVLLAQMCNTNTTYLSSVINHEKGTSFPNYLKNMKIDFALKELSQNASLLKYNYQGLAEQFGFKTAESFSKAFYNRTKVFPSKYLEALRSQNKGSNL